MPKHNISSHIIARPQCLALIAVAALSLSACAAVAPDTYGVSPERLAQIEQICISTMGTPRGNVQFYDCVTSLSSTARQLDRPRQP